MKDGHVCDSASCHLHEAIPGFGEVGCVWRGNRAELPGHECTFRTAEASCNRMLEFAWRVRETIEDLEAENQDLRDRNLRLEDELYDRQVHLIEDE